MRRIAIAERKLMADMGKARKLTIAETFSKNDFEAERARIDSELETVGKERAVSSGWRSSVSNKSMTS